MCKSGRGWLTRRWGGSTIYSFISKRGVWLNRGNYFKRHGPGRGVAYTSEYGTIMLERLRYLFYLNLFSGLARNIELLLKFGSDPKVLDSSGNAPVTLAAKEKGFQCVRLLCIEGK